METLLNQTHCTSGRNLGCETNFKHQMVDWMCRIEDSMFCLKLHSAWQLYHQLCLHNSLLKMFIKLLWPWKLKMSLKSLWPCKCKLHKTLMSLKSLWPCKYKLHKTLMLNALPEFIVVEFEISTQKSFFWLEGSKNCPWSVLIFSFETWPTVGFSSFPLCFLVPPQLAKDYSISFLDFRVFIISNHIRVDLVLISPNKRNNKTEFPSLCWFLLFTQSR